MKTARTLEFLQVAGIFAIAYGTGIFFLRQYVAALMLQTVQRYGLIDECLVQTHESSQKNSKSEKNAVDLNCDLIRFNFSLDTENRIREVLELNTG